jgi:hypothetical protein
VRRLIANALAFILIASLFTAPARADDKSDINAVVTRMAHALNTGDQKVFASLVAPATQAVIDEIPPHYWNGPNAISNWYRDFGSVNKALGVTDALSMFSAAKYIEVDGNRAWATFPMVYTYKMKGAAQRETGTLSIALEKVAAGWRVLGFAWGRGS